MVEEEKLDKLKDLTTEQAEFLTLEWEMARAETNKKACGINRTLFLKGISQLKKKGIDKDKIKTIKDEYFNCKKKPMSFDHDKTGNLSIVNMNGLSGKCPPDKLDKMIEQMEEEGYAVLFEQLLPPYSKMREFLVEIGFISWKDKIIRKDVKAPKTKEEYDATTR